MNMMHLLDNPVWSALSTGNANLSFGNDKVKSYRPDVSPFVGIIDNSAENLNLLHDLLYPQSGVIAVVVPSKLEMPAQWTVSRSISLMQMVCHEPIFRKPISERIVDLTDRDVEQMLALTKLTNPGPFLDRTIDFGFYQGIFDGNTLIAMAGQRMHSPPYAEISAVCTHPNYTGNGYAVQLILSQIKRIASFGEIPFLHVAADNVRAISLYESLGFTKRAEMITYFLSNNNTRVF